jgi:hypothetical protein
MAEADPACSTDADCAATASGIFECLRMLAQEAASLNLARTLGAITAALEACASERDGRGPISTGTLH